MGTPPRPSSRVQNKGAEKNAARVVEAPAAALGDAGARAQPRLASRAEEDQLLGSGELIVVTPSRQPTTGRRASRVEVEDAIFAVQQAAFSQIERYQAYVEGVVLAAEQVQDKRLELVEKKDEVTATDVLLDFFVALALNSTIAGGVLSKLSRLCVQRSYATGAGYGLMRQMARNRDAVPRPEQVDATLEQFQALLQKHASKDNQEAAKWFRVTASRIVQNPEELEELAAIGVSVVAESGRSAIQNSDRQAALRDFATARMLSDGESVGVSVVRMAYEHAANARAFIRTQYAGFERLIRLGAFDSAQLAKFVNLLKAPPLGAPVEHVRLRYLSLYEAVIWSKIYRFRARELMPKPIPGSPYGGIDGVEDRILHYWIRRFSQPIKEWSRNAERNYERRVAFKGEAKRIYTFDEELLEQVQPKQAQVDYVHQFMWALDLKAPVPPEAIQLRKPQQLGTFPRYELDK